MGKLLLAALDGGPSENGALHYIYHHQQPIFNRTAAKIKRSRESGNTSNRVLHIKPNSLHVYTPPVHDWTNKQKTNLLFHELAI
jgi:hypothetical protein